ncbi:MAG: hypothetical protein BWY76_03415 [bacterium ADurb.Bin429]|nr:MAG: hypothetical protein BWY76_03415 [bacterium ADurb.Bin429]
MRMVVPSSNSSVYCRPSFGSFCERSPPKSWPGRLSVPFSTIFPSVICRWSMRMALSVTRKAGAFAADGALTRPASTRNGSN